MVLFFSFISIKKEIFYFDDYCYCVVDYGNNISKKKPIHCLDIKTCIEINNIQKNIGNSNGCYYDVIQVIENKRCGL